MALRNKKFELSPRLKLGIGRGYSQNQILKFSAVVCLTLALALTVNAFRLVLKDKNQAGGNSQNPQVLGATDVKQPGSPSGAKYTAYTVQKGDTLFNISQKFNIDWTTLATLNNLKSPFVLKPGQIINIPK